MKSKYLTIYVGRRREEKFPPIRAARMKKKKCSRSNSAIEQTRNKRQKKEESILKMAHALRKQSRWEIVSKFAGETVTLDNWECERKSKKRLV